jgi:ferrous iron transport protein A
MPALGNGKVLELGRGDVAVVVGYRTRGDEADRYEEMGLTPGARFRVVKVAPLGDPVEIDLRGYRLCLRKRELEGIEVRRAD